MPEMLGPSDGYIIPPEGEAKQSSLVDITNADPEAQELLREALQNSSGNARILVHPRYVYHLYPDLPAQYLSDLERFVSTSDQNPVGPLIVYEEEKKVDELSGVLKDEDAFLVRTVEDYAVPASSIFDSLVDNGVSLNRARNKAAQAVASMYRHAGMTHAQVGGRCLFRITPENFEERQKMKAFDRLSVGSQSSRGWVQRGEYPAGCVGGVITRLMFEGIEVSLSPAVSPNADPYDHPLSLFYQFLTGNDS